jgi:hypothetical protein
MIIIFNLTILGILDTGYLSYIHLFGGQACGQGSGCSFVLSSPYTRIFGIPLSTLGLDMDRFKECMESGQGEKMVEADIAEGAELGINGTPGVFMNGHFINGVPTEKQVQLILDKYLPKKSES